MNRRIFDPNKGLTRHEREQRTRIFWNSVLLETIARLNPTMDMRRYIDALADEDARPVGHLPEAAR